MTYNKEIFNLEKNITELKKELQVALEKNEYQKKIIFNQAKMAAMGEMINIIAHQWKQPLNSVSILVQEIFFNLKINNCENVVDITLKKEIEGQLDYMSQTIDDFKNFFQKDKVKVEINIVKLIDNILKLLAMQLRSYNIQVNIQLGHKSKYIEYNKDFTLKEFFNTNYLVTSYINELKQVLLNILLNSKDVLVSHIQNGEMRSINILIDKNDNRSISIVIEDNGGGISSKEELENIWKPYFTTKDEGTGIGLYISKLIMENSLESSIESNNGNIGLQTKLIINNL